MLLKKIKTDVTVVGGGFSGVCAAIAAARQGLSVALVHDRPTFGGNSSQEIGVGISGAAHSGTSPSVYTKEGGVSEEIKLEIAHYGSRDIAYYEAVYREPNIQSFLNTTVFEVEMDGDKIKSVTGVQIGSETKFQFESPIFIDSSGDGTVAFEAGAEYMMGTEGRDEFGECLAPEEANKYTMGDSIMFSTVDVGHPTVYHRPAFAYDITKLPFFKNLTGINDKNGLHRFIFRRDSGIYYGFWWIEFGGQLNTIYDNADITLELRKLVYGFWDYIKNSGKFEGVENLELSHVPSVTGKRESRRFVGDTILTQNHIDTKYDFDDAVAIAGWAMDVHAPLGIYDDRPASNWHYVSGSYNIPFSMMYSKNVSNLMLAGRNMSSTHVAFGSARVAVTGGVAGQAVGTAAALCLKYNKTPREIKNEHIKELQEILLKQDQTIIGVKEPVNPSLYKDIKVEATSTKKYENHIVEDNIRLGDFDTGIALPVKERLESVKIGFKNTDAENDVEVAVKIYGGERKENYIAQKLLKEFTVKLEKGFDDWKKLDINCKPIGDDKIYILFEKNEKVEIYGTNRHLTGAYTFGISERIVTPAHDTIKYKSALNSFRARDFKPVTEMCFKDVEPYCDIYSVENIINGYSRPYGTPNIWISETEAKDSEQTITMTYDVPKEINEIQLVFNNLLEEDHTPNGTPYCLVKSYKLEVVCEDKTEVIEVNDNYQRINYIKQHFENVKQLKLTLKENYGSEYFELYAIKLF